MPAFLLPAKYNYFISVEEFKTLVEDKEKNEPGSGNIELGNTNQTNEDVNGAENPELEEIGSRLNNQENSNQSRPEVIKIITLD